MLVTLKLSLASLIILILTYGLTVAQDLSAEIDCFSWTGTVFPNNVACPGSRICCATTEACNSNRFCIQNNQTVIPPCSLFPWQNCANICQYDLGTGYLPRAQECPDGSFCCDNDPACCTQNRGIVLNGLGAIVSTNSGLPTSTSSTTTSTMADITTASNASTMPRPIQSSQSSVSTGLSMSAKVGIGVGAAVGGAGVAFLAVLLINRRRDLERKARKTFEKQDSHPNGRQYQEMNGEARWHEMHGDSQYYKSRSERRPQEIGDIGSKPPQFFEMEASSKTT